MIKSQQIHAVSDRNIHHNHHKIYNTISLEEEDMNVNKAHQSKPTKATYNLNRRITT